MTQKSFTLKSGPFTLKGIHHLPKTAPAPYVISAHGMLSTKDSPKYITLGKKLVETGFGFIRFDFTGCGESTGTLPEATTTQRVRDLLNVIDWVATLKSFSGNLGIFGSSLGGSVALAAGVQRPVHALVLLATPVKHARHPSPELQEVQKAHPHFFDDFHDAIETLPFETLHHCLIIHGSQDNVVSPENAFYIYEKTSPPKEIWIVGGADHQFSDESLRTTMLSMSVRWFKRFLHPSPQS